MITRSVGRNRSNRIMRKRRRRPKRDVTVIFAIIANIIIIIIEYYVLLHINTMERLSAVHSPERFFDTVFCSFCCMVLYVHRRWVQQNGSERGEKLAIPDINANVYSRENIEWEPRVLKRNVKVTERPSSAERLSAMLAAGCSQFHELV